MTEYRIYFDAEDGEWNVVDGGDIGATFKYRGQARRWAKRFYDTAGKAVRR